MFKPSGIFIKNPFLGKYHIMSMRIENFMAYFPECRELLEVMADLLPKKRNLYVRLISKNYLINEKTCSNTHAHVDGIDSDYALICWGEFRTEFYQGHKIHIPSLDTPREKSSFIESLELANSDFFEINEGEIATYNSEDIHRGRVFNQTGARTFLRLMSTDRVMPNHRIA